MQTGAAGQKPKVKKGAPKKSAATYVVSVYNTDGEQIDREHNLTVWDAVLAAQAAQDKGLLAKVSPAVPIEVLKRTRRKPIGN